MSVAAIPPALEELITACTTLKTSVVAALLILRYTKATHEATCNHIPGHIPKVQGPLFRAAPVLLKAVLYLRLLTLRRSLRRSSCAFIFSLSYRLSSHFAINFQHAAQLAYFLLQVVNGLIQFVKFAAGSDRQV